MVNTNDIALVVGICLAVLAVPSLLNAWTEDRAPRLGALMGLTGLVLVAVAISRHPGGYGFGDVPAAFHRVFKGLLN